MQNRTEPKTVWQWIRYLVVAVIAMWLVLWMRALKCGSIVGINLFAVLRIAHPQREPS